MEVIRDRLTDEQLRLVSDALAALRDSDLALNGFNDIDTVKNTFELAIGHADREYFAVAFLIDMRLVEFDVMFKGERYGVYVNIKDILRKALLLDATGIIVGHNHPSGKSVFSQDDLALTTSIQQACINVDIELHDHILVADTVISMVEEDML